MAEETKMDEETMDEETMNEETMNEEVNVFLYITRHGEYNVTYKDSKLDILQKECPVKSLIRYNFAPLGACSWDEEESDITTYNKIETYVSYMITSIKEGNYKITSNIIYDIFKL